MRYTSESTMDDRALRDVERWKEKIEVRLDNRQVFFLFFGSAMVACLLFVLGVIVGKRLESRGRAQSPAEDPLAALDRLSGVAAPSPAAAPAAPAEPMLTFPGALLGGGGKSKAAAPVARPAAKAVVAGPTLASAAPSVAVAAPAAASAAKPAVALAGSKLAALPRPLSAPSAQAATAAHAEQA